jgi:carbonic anhydrase
MTWPMTERVFERANQRDGTKGSLVPEGRTSDPSASAIERLLTANEAYAAARSNTGNPRPLRRLAVVTCMDARIDVFAALGLHLGEAHVIRNAGGRVTEDVLRSLAVSSHVLGVDTVVVMQHTKCGLAGVSNDQLRQMTGAELEFFSFDDHAAALHDDIDVLTSKPYLSPLRTVAGFVFDVETGYLHDVVRWQRPD